MRHDTTHILTLWLVIAAYVVQGAMIVPGMVLCVGPGHVAIEPSNDHGCCEHDSDGDEHESEPHAEICDTDCNGCLDLTGNPNPSRIEWRTDGQWKLLALNAIHMLVHTAGADGASASLILPRCDSILAVAPSVGTVRAVVRQI